MPFDPFGGRPGFRYISDPLGRFGFGRFVPKRLLPDPFGRLPATAKPDPELVNLGDLSALGDSVGMGGRNDRRDVAKVENLLGRVGALDLAETDGLTGFFGARTDEAIRRFQKRHGLKMDGRINPGGETIVTLAAMMAAEKDREKKDDDKKRIPEPPSSPMRPGETRDPMDTHPTVPGTLDENEIEKFRRILRRKRGRRA